MMANSRSRPLSPLPPLSTLSTCLPQQLGPQLQHLLRRRLVLRAGCLRHSITRLGSVSRSASQPGKGPPPQQQHRQSCHTNNVRPPTHLCPSLPIRFIQPPTLSSAL